MAKKAKTESPETTAKAKPEEAATVRPGTKRATAQKDGPLVYVGPNLPNAGINHGQVFRGGLPPALADAVSPAFKQLIIPIAGLPQAKKALADGTTALAKAYKTAGTEGEGTES